MAANNKYPVVFFVFKRPDTTQDFLTRIQAASINKIYIFGDGPRTEGEKKLTEQVKAIVASFAKSNPEIAVVAQFSKTNQGLKESIIAGLTSVFSQEEAAIILEDDCKPSPDFFVFASTMLTRYKNNARVMSITGTSVGKLSRFSYDFSKYQMCWGWATWARAWAKYDRDLTGLESSAWQQLRKVIWPSKLVRWYWSTILKFVQRGWIDTWDYQWSYSHFLHHGLAIVPSTNLISNIGFDSAATNTKFRTRVAAMEASPMQFPLVDPPMVKENSAVSRMIERYFYSNPVAIGGLIKTWITKGLLT